MIICHIIAPIAFGGGESLLVNLLSCKQQSCNEIVISLFSSKPLSEKLAKISIKNIEITQISLEDGISKLQMLLRAFLLMPRIWEIYRLLKQENVNCIHAHGFPASILCYFLKKLTSIKVVYTHHFVREQPNFLEKVILGLCYKSFDFCVGVSETVSQSMRRFFPVSTDWKTIHNCIGENFFKPQIKDSYSHLRQGKEYVFVQIARFSKFKNQSLVLQSLANLPSHFREKILVIFVGAGECLEPSKSLAEDLLLSNSVLFLGRVDYDDIPSVIAQVDYGLFPSEVEGFGLGAVECLALGKPVLSLNTPLMQEIVGSSGLQSSKANFSCGLLEMTKSGHSLRQVAREQAQHHRPDYVKSKYCRLYTKAMTIQNEQN